MLPAPWLFGTHSPGSLKPLTESHSCKMGCVHLTNCFPGSSASSTFRYMSKITRTQKLGVSRWRATSRATICPELPGRGSRGPWIPYLQSFSYTPPCTVVASFELCHRDTPHFSLCLIAATDEHSFARLHFRGSNPENVL